MLHVTADELPIILPSDWSDITLGQFYKYLEAKTDTEILLALSDVQLDQLRETRAYDLDDIVINQLSYLSKLPKFLSLPVPDQLTIDGKVIDVPKEVGEQITYGQKKDLEDELGNLPNQDHLPEPERIPDYILAARTFLSIYLCPLVTGKRYSKSSQAYDLIPLIDQLPVTDALPLAAFFEEFFESKAEWETQFQDSGSKENNFDEQARAATPNLEHYVELFALKTIAEFWRIETVEAIHLPYDWAMQALAATHQKGIYHSHYNRLSTPKQRRG